MTVIVLWVLTGLLCWLLAAKDMISGAAALGCWGGALVLELLAVLIWIRPAISQSKYSGNVFLAPGGVLAETEKEAPQPVREVMIIDITALSAFLWVKTESGKVMQFPYAADSLFSRLAYKMGIDEGELARHCEACGIAFRRAPLMVFLKAKMGGGEQ